MTVYFVLSNNNHNMEKLSAGYFIKCVSDRSWKRSCKVMEFHMHKMIKTLNPITIVIFIQDSHYNSIFIH